MKEKDHMYSLATLHVNMENELYSAIEAAIIRWNLDGTKTAGELTREIISIIKQQDSGRYNNVQ